MMHRIRHDLRSGKQAVIGNERMADMSQSNGMLLRALGGLFAVRTFLTLAPVRFPVNASHSVLPRTRVPILPSLFAFPSSPSTHSRLMHTVFLLVFHLPDL